MKRLETTTHGAGQQKTKKRWKEMEKTMSINRKPKSYHDGSKHSLQHRRNRLARTKPAQEAYAVDDHRYDAWTGASKASLRHLRSGAVEDRKKMNTSGLASTKPVHNTNEVDERRSTNNFLV